MALTLDPNWFAVRKVLEKILGIMEKCRENFSLFFPRRKFSLDELFHQRPNFFFPEKFY